MADINTEQFIDEVRKRPSIWDSSSEDYKNKHVRRNMWAEVCEVLFPGYNKMGNIEKVNIGKDMRIKWKSIRDCYNRSLRLIKRKSGKKQKPMKTYVYAPYLTFLNATFTPHQTETYLERVSDKPVAGVAETQLGDDTEIEIIDDLDESSENSEERRKRKPITTNSYYRSKRKNYDSKLENYPKNFQREPQEKEGESNDDIDFFRSLIPIIKDLPVEEKIKFRIDVMKLTLEYKQRFPAPSPSVHLP
uniref:(California timema) hypothetical protein n=1 Tax=Timema californicum TaxID=61474 RepID=A0A7R9JHJ0_TIMCA|nr:unnamed protein product [Timema californicum]